MFNKEQIIRLLNDERFDNKCYWVVAGAAMVLHGIKEYTNDIDLGCNKEMADRLQKIDKKVDALDNGSRRIEYNDYIKIFEDWKEGQINIIDSLPVVSLDGIIIMKKQLGREKDMQDIELIKNYIPNRT